MPPKAAAAGGKKSQKQASAPKPAEKFPPGMKLKDVCTKNWELGTIIGKGGFGYVYLASEATVDRRTETYVIKIEPKDSGPLFCEMHFYMRVATLKNINKFKRVHHIRHLGVPPYIASGTKTYKSRDYRFLVMPHLGTDLQQLLHECGGRFSPKTTYSVGLRIVDALHFIHDNDYVHADIKASNILQGCSEGHDVADDIYLVDYGLAYRYTVDGKHIEYEVVPERAHDGTLEFTSRDAHKGLAPSRRGDLEILGYCMLQWICGELPWENKLTDPNYVAKSKEIFMGDLNTQLTRCLPGGLHSGCLLTYFRYVDKLQYQSRPNYDHIRDIFRNGLRLL